MWNGLGVLALISKMVRYGNVLNDIENAYKNHAQRVVPTKHDVYSYRGHLHVDIDHIEVYPTLIMVRHQGSLD